MPRKSSVETVEEYEAKLAKWNDESHHPVEVKRKGNSMTAKYYAENLLPLYIDEINAARVERDGGCFGVDDWGDGAHMILQEDNDRSHGTTQGKSLPRSLKDRCWIYRLKHPAQSPNLNPIEAIWGILKQRIKRRIWDTLDELKQILVEEWEKITMEEIRARIAEMRLRCRMVVDRGGEFVKTDLW
ncbi:hypothetical protein P152DRAFT_478359 [Eremomyces bilateralis CBS 781.70]|uniref:Tc1-like transposase DDE domain-containing protein n=1 Tax=Eremomyces bilateralis CBS 781.70 TaxID=1392243 RepID=A0A6G1GGY5_9PEZI|nr:uncharacterized protein P152DRAFT_478359 [Eremomyces bilateralis CBS 781.70]KAF1817365.1 hypothetical protein P152DRAFT_478359 [Eremomyces bilateralis CBS 781.70]